MHLDLTTTSQSVNGFGPNRFLAMITSDPNCVVHVFAADSAGVSGAANGLLLGELTYRFPKMELRDGSTYVFYVLKSGAPPSAIWMDADAVATPGITTIAAFGDGSDGTQSFDGTSTVLGLVPSASAYTLTRDILLANGTIAPGVTIKAAGYKIFCAGTFTNNGTISNNGGAGGVGSAGTGGTAGAAGAAGSTGGGTAGGAGGSAGVGVAGTASFIGFPNPVSGAGVGGAGGGDGTHAGGAAGGNTPLAASTGAARHAIAALTAGVFGAAGLWSTVGGGAGGGGGASDNADAGGGGGGGGGGVTFVAAFNLVNNGTIEAIGGNGGNGFSTAHNAGTGAGGGGGVVYAISRLTSGTGSFSVAGGAAGATKVGSAGVVGAAGAAGTVLAIAA